MHLVVLILTNILRSSILLAEIVMVLSSAKLHKDPLLIMKKTSVIRILKKNGPRIDPCGTPWFGVPHLQKYPLNFTDCFLSVR